MIQDDGLFFDELSHPPPVVLRPSLDVLHPGGLTQKRCRLELLCGERATQHAPGWYLAALGVRVVESAARWRHSGDRTGTPSRRPDPSRRGSPSPARSGVIPPDVTSCCPLPFASARAMLTQTGGGDPLCPTPPFGGKKCQGEPAYIFCPPPSRASHVGGGENKKRTVAVLCAQGGPFSSCWPHHPVIFVGLFKNLSALEILG